MPKAVEASTISAGQLFSTNRFSVPSFQREYSWSADDEVADFWRDLSSSLSDSYFLGLIILTDEGDRRTIVDGQQRFITLTILANVLCLAARSEGRRLVADSIRDTFLYSIDYRTEERIPRLYLTSEKDRDSLERLLSLEDWLSSIDAEGDAILEAHNLLATALSDDLKNHKSTAIRLGEWAEFLSANLNFTVFLHPDRNAAFKVYEVVNTRGKDLTPAELIKAFLIGSSSRGGQDDTFRRWVSLERQFQELGAGPQMTQFIRHAATLRHGYVIPRNLYQVVTEHYANQDGVESLLDFLDKQLPLYRSMIEPGIDSEQSDIEARAFALLEGLGLRTVRPVFMAVAQSRDSDEGIRELIRIIVPRAVSGSFGTGATEAKFAKAAQRVFETHTWNDEVSKLSEELKPSRSDFMEKAAKSLNREYAKILRSIALQKQLIPDLSYFLHYVRPRYADGWPDFNDEDFRLVGTTLGNTFLAKVERRPHGSKTLAGVREKLIPQAAPREILTGSSFDSFSVDRVRELTESLVHDLAQVLYDEK